MKKTSAESTYNRFQAMRRSLLWWFVGTAVTGLMGSVIVLVGPKLPMLFSTLSWASDVSQMHMRQFVDTCTKREKTGNETILRDTPGGVRQSETYACQYGGIGDNWSGAVYYPYPSFANHDPLPEKLKSFLASTNVSILPAVVTRGIGATQPEEER